MSFKINTQRGGKPTATSITNSQRSTCQAVFYRFSKPDITKIKNLNVSTDRSISGQASDPSQGNLNSPQDLVIIRNDVIRCSISKSKGASSGTFSLTLKRGKKVTNGVVQTEDIDYLQLINPGDWVMIYLKKSGTVDTSSIAVDSGLKFLGIVENVRYIEVDDPGKAAPRLEYIVTGRDFGKVFENEIFFNPLVNNETIQTLLGVKFLSDSVDSVRGSNRSITSGFSPDKVIKNLVSFYLGGSFASLNVNNQVWYVPKLLGRTFRPELINKRGGISFVDVLNTNRIGLHQYDRNSNFKSADKLPGAALIKSLPSTGTVWGVLQFMQNAAINEMFTDLVPVNGNLQPSLVMRQVPFSNFKNNETGPFAANARTPENGGNGAIIQDKIADSQKTYFASLPRLEIVSSNIRQKNVGKSDHERINHVIITPKIDSSVYDILYGTSYNVASIQRYGLRSIQTQTSYVLDSTESIRSFLERCLFLITDWFFLAHQLFNGTLIIDGVDNHIELGSNLFISDVEQLYHIEGYTHTYELTEDSRTMYNTELRVSRGQVWKEGTRQTNFIGSTTLNKEQTTISTSVIEGVKK